MKFNKFFKKGQALPLNTIVIAILVILVLLVIVMFFTSNVGETGETIENQGSVSACDVSSNPAIKTLGYRTAEYLDADDCSDRRGTEISVVSKNDDGEICCGWK